MIMRDRETFIIDPIFMLYDFFRIFRLNHRVIVLSRSDVPRLSVAVLRFCLLIILAIGNSCGVSKVINATGECLTKFAENDVAPSPNGRSEANAAAAARKFVTNLLATDV